MKNKTAGGCPFLGDKKNPPPGPEGEDIEMHPLETPLGTLEIKAGQAFKSDEGTTTFLRKIRRCPNGEVYGMLEFPTGFVWSPVEPAPIPEPTEFQKRQIEEAERKVPRAFQMLGDWSRKVGDRISFSGTGEKQRSGTIGLMVSTRPCVSAGLVVAMDDGSMIMTDDAEAVLNGRVDLGKGRTA